MSTKPKVGRSGFFAHGCSGQNPEAIETDISLEIQQNKTFIFKRQIDLAVFSEIRDWM